MCAGQTQRRHALPALPQQGLWLPLAGDHVWILSPARQPVACSGFKRDVHSVCFWKGHQFRPTLDTLAKFPLFLDVLAHEPVGATVRPQATSNCAGSNSTFQSTGISWCVWPSGWDLSYHSSCGVWPLVLHAKQVKVSFAAPKVCFVRAAIWKHFHSAGPHLL